MMIRNWYVDSDIQVSEITILNEIMKMDALGMLI